MNHLLFTELDLSPEVNKGISEMGFEEATPIQSQAIPHILRGTDIIGQAQTGTGKTCAFGIPVIEKTDPGNESIQGLILCPTRELAIQTAEELTNVAKYKKGIRILPIYGGQPIDRQISALRQRPQIIIGTPGRIMDHLRRHTLKLSHLKMLVLDEADEMLNMGFREDIDIILTKISREKQTILFSATMPKEILDLTGKYQKNPLFIKAIHKELTVSNIEQFYLEVNESSKPEILARLLDTYNLKRALVFCNTKKRVDELAAHLQSMGYLAEALHGDMNQSQRDKVMSGFRRGMLDVLIATDVAARGIDVDDVTAVFNYDIPTDEEYYVHRIGRTGRIGKAGKAFTLVSGRGIYKLKEIQRYTKSVILPLKPPTFADVEEYKINKLLEKLKTAISAGDLSRHRAMIEKLIEESKLNQDPENYLTTLDIAAAFLKITSDQNMKIDSSTSSRETIQKGDTNIHKGRKRPYHAREFPKSQSRRRRNFETKVSEPPPKWLS
jgi:ATP-dependent RNA helicase DeaD